MSVDTSSCLLCIDGLMPAGTDPVFGQTYQQCPRCLGICPCCQGAGFYPAHMQFFEFLIDALYALGYEVDQCRDCRGVTDLYFTETEATP
jgi:hypothetical protein